MRLLFCDCETGGLNPETDALLSVGLVDFQDGKILRTEEILVDPEGLACEPKAMEVNRIDLDIHCAYAVTRKEAAQRISQFIQPMSRPFVCGHNVAFDVSFIRRLFAAADLRRLVSHRCLDTMQVLAYLGHCGRIPDGIGKLDQAIAHFGIEVPAGQRHTALADALATAQLYTRLLAVVR